MAIGVPLLIFPQMFLSGALIPVAASTGHPRHPGQDHPDDLLDRPRPEHLLLGQAGVRRGRPPSVALDLAVTVGLLPGLHDRRARSSSSGPTATARGGPGRGRRGSAARPGRSDSLHHRERLGHLDTRPAGEDRATPGQRDRGVEVVGLDDAVAGRVVRGPVADRSASRRSSWSARPGCRRRRARRRACRTNRSTRPSRPSVRPRSQASGRRGTRAGSWPSGASFRPTMSARTSGDRVRGLLTRRRTDILEIDR